ncbi:aminoglycoside adenylyltransferase domain-containing protein [Kitasatospora sp. NPDC097643]|uniref:aminoglycoside adenylyltransferase domain-containing protein n=1 Tax=Kitasatospora sp. NPDC097643 TaxID=3157230 RepID=UPI003323E096
MRCYFLDRELHRSFYRPASWKTCGPARFDVAWSQRYAVTTYCRALFTLHTGEVTSKRGALEWARETLDPRWRPLLTQVIQDRELGWDPTDPP